MGVCARINSGCLLFTVADLATAPEPLVLIALAVTVGGPPSLDGVVVIRATTPPAIPPIADGPNKLKLALRDDASLVTEQVVIDRSAGAATAVVCCANATAGRNDTVANSANKAFMALDPHMTVSPPPSSTSAGSL